jgi:hypothetical protein
MQYFEWLRYQHSANGRITFCGQTKCVLRVRVCSTPTAVTSGQRDNLHTICCSVSVWTGIVGDNVVGPYLASDRLNAQRYRDYLETVVPGMFEEMPLSVTRSSWFQHCGAPAHYAEEVRQWLHATSPGRWTGRRGPIAWPPRSPDLTPIKFSLWGHLKEYVYVVSPMARKEFISKLQAAVTTVDVNRLRRVLENPV